MAEGEKNKKGVPGRECYASHHEPGAVRSGDGCQRGVASLPAGSVAEEAHELRLATSSPEAPT